MENKENVTLNLDEGAYHLDNIYDSLISIPPSMSGGLHYKKSEEENRCHIVGGSAQ